MGALLQPINAYSILSYFSQSQW